MPDLTREEFLTIKAGIEAAMEVTEYERQGDQSILKEGWVERIEAAALTVDNIYRIYKEHRR